MNSHTFAALSLALCLSACGDDAEARYAGLTSVERSSPLVAYSFRYRAPPWERRDKDPLAVEPAATVSIGGARHAIEAGTATVLEIGTQTVANVPGENLPKYRLTVALVRCTDAELTSQTSCAHALYERDRVARSKTLTPGGESGAVTDAGDAYLELFARDEANRRNQRVVFYETPVAHTAAWLFIEGFPALNEIEITRMVRAITVGAPKAGTL